MPVIGRTDTFGGMWGDACERCGQIPLGDVGECLSGCGRMPLGEGVRSFDLGSLYL